MTPRDLVTEHLPLVEALATRIHAGHAGGPSRDDLVGYGVIGLIEAAKRFRQEAGAPFAAFAYRRICGAITDGLRLAYGSRKWGGGLPAEAVVSFGPQHDRAVEGPSAEESLLEAERPGWLQEAIASLPDRERALVEAVDLGGRTLEDVGAGMGITKSWASRQRKVALGMLRERLS